MKQDAINSLKYSPKINKTTFSHSDCCSRLLANGGLLLTTGHYLLTSCIIVKHNAINSLKYSPKINKTTFSHSDCCRTCQWWGFTYYGSFEIFTERKFSHSVYYSRLVANGKLLLIMGDLFCEIGWE